MTKTALALATPGMLRWGRQSARLTLDEAGAKASIDPGRIEQWELGTEAPTIAQLKSLAKIYKRPLGAFYLDAPPKDFSVPKDYRRLPHEKEGEISSGLALEIRRAHEQREAAIELAELAGEATKAWPVAPKATTAEEVAAAARRRLKVAVAEQMRWRDKYAAFNGWRDAVEATGVMVLQASGIKMDEMRGISLHFDSLPIILLNRKDRPRGRLFSLLHEYAHLFLGSEGLCDTHDGKDSDPEVFCNQVAAAILMPALEFMEDHRVKSRPNYYTGWDEATLQDLSRSYGASEESVLRRLLSLHKTTHAFYAERRREYQRRYEQLPEETGPVPVAVRKAGEVGPLFVRYVMGALDRQAININDASAYLDVKVRHLDAMRENITA